MDWKYILSIRPEQLSEDAKDELMNTIAWFELQPGELDKNKSFALLRISQEILKYKSEQVEALLAELDEVARRQGEEEVRKQDSDYDIKSVKSKKSGSIDQDEFDGKFRELKIKYKKQQKVIDKINEDNEKLKQTVSMLEQERIHLQNELHRTHNEESGSDISEIIKDQHKDLIDNIHQKNSHISQLLTDIENIEGDNLVLRNKLTTVRDEMSDATEKLDLLMSEVNVSQVKFDEMNETVERLKMENEGLKLQVVDIVEDKRQRETEFEEFAKGVDDRVEEWKNILQDKNEEIERLQKSNLTKAPISSSSSEASTKDDFSQLNALNRAIDERDSQIFALQSQLQSATREMDASTEFLEKVASERNNIAKKYDKVNTLLKDMKKQLKASHGRCQELQDDVQYQESLVEMKDDELKKMIDSLEVEDLNIKSVLVQVQDLRTQKKFKEKQISDLVRTCNKLRSSVELLEKENVALRARLGLSDSDYVSTKTVTSIQRKQKKSLENTKLAMQRLEEEKLALRLELQKLAKVVANLCDQIIDLGDTPNVEGAVPVHKIDEGVEIKEEISKERYVAMVEENDALRKGLHEILESVHLKQESTAKEIKSDTLESLIRALDVKHISGWYHPAMRLQAELHALQGSNTELREQLRSTREELEKYKDHIPVSYLETNLTTMEAIEDSSNAAVISNLNKHLLNVLKNYRLEEETNTNLVEKLKNYKHEFAVVQAQVGLLYDQYISEKQTWETEFESATTSKQEFEEKALISESKLNTFELYANPATDEATKAHKVAEMSAELIILNRKCVYLENQETGYRNDLQLLRNEMLKCETAVLNKINNLNAENKSLSDNIIQFENTTTHTSQENISLQKHYDDTLIKQRQLLKTIEEIRLVTSNELELCNRQVSLLQDEKRELENQLVVALQEKASISGDVLSKKLAQSEVNEITERQRANHTNNLYELVKDQLLKSEERYKEYQKYNNEIMHKNLLLQETVKDLEDRIMNFVDGDVFRSLENEHLRVVRCLEEVTVARNKIEGDLAVCKKELEAKQVWASLDQYEFLSLRHQIVDLQAVGDDKSVIARLSSDVVAARMAEVEIKRRLEETSEELVRCQDEQRVIRDELAGAKERFLMVKSGLENKIRHLETVIKQQRSHYLGYIPFISEERFIANVAAVYEDKKAILEKLQSTEVLRNECKLAKDNLSEKINILNELRTMIDNGDGRCRELEVWQQEKSNVQLQGLRFKRQAEFKESQLQESLSRLSKEEQKCAQLELELLQSLSLKESKDDKLNKDAKIIRDLHKTTCTIVEIQPKGIKSTKTEETQTLQEVPQSTRVDVSVQNIILNLENELSKSRDENALREEVMQQMKQKITELEMNVSLFRQQIGDKQSQITFYEKHIMEMQQKKEQPIEGAVVTGGGDGEEIMALKVSINELKEKIESKDGTILKYQSLLKKDRDEHSFAAVRFQEELKQLQMKINELQDVNNKKSVTVEEHPSRAAIEHYIVQVHALEKHTSELHTSVKSLDSQLQASRQEAVRWRSLAYERLHNMDELRVSIEDQHQAELQAYREDSEKWREEVKQIQHVMLKYKKDISELRPDIEKELKDKDNKIHELTVTLRQLRSGARKKPATVGKEDNFEEVKEGLIREHDVLKKRFEQLMHREKNAREEIRTLKGQLMKKPMLSARSDSTASKDSHRHKKVSALEKEIEELKEKLDREAALNEAHKSKVHEDFEKWNKQKFWQQTAEKHKQKLKERQEEFEKLQQTCSGYRMLIERLEREKHNLENRMRMMKVTTAGSSLARLEVLDNENGKLRAENEVLRGKLEMRHHHAGALSSAMLQEKLEAQERKIAVLEMSSKGSGELRAELERLQACNADSQKCNLRLEAECLELRLDLQRSCKELPHLRDQLVHLENYIEVLKTEEKHEVSNSGDHGPLIHAGDTKKISELERTVFVLKRIVEKLQVENKRLAGGSRPCSDRVGSAERLRREHRRLKEQLGESVQTIGKLEKELESARGGKLEELEDVRLQLKQKSELLDKVKVLLHRAAAKEKALVEQIEGLKGMIPQEHLRTIVCAEIDE